MAPAHGLVVFVTLMEAVPNDAAALPYFGCKKPVSTRKTSSCAQIGVQNARKCLELKPRWGFTDRDAEISRV